MKPVSASSYQAIFFGIDTPQYTLWSVVVAFYILAPRAVYGGIADFIPSAEWSSFAGRWVHFGAAIFGCIYFYGIVLRKLPLRTPDGREFSSGRKGLVFIMFSVAIWMGLSIALEHGVGAIATRLLGDEHAETIHAITSYSNDRRGCDYKARSGFIHSAFPSYVCISAEAFMRNPDRRVDLNLRGYRDTQFGFLITKF